MTYQSLRGQIRAAVQSAPLPPPVPMNPVRERPIYPVNHGAPDQFVVEPFNRKLTKQALESLRVRLTQESARFLQLHKECLVYGAQAEDESARAAFDGVSARLLQVAAICDAAIDLVPPNE